MREDGLLPDIASRPIGTSVAKSLGQCEEPRPQRLWLLDAMKGEYSAHCGPGKRYAVGGEQETSSFKNCDSDSSSAIAACRAGNRPVTALTHRDGRVWSQTRQTEPVLLLLPFDTMQRAKAIAGTSSSRADVAKHLRGNYPDRLNL